MSRFDINKKEDLFLKNTIFEDSNYYQELTGESILLTNKYFYVTLYLARNLAYNKKEYSMSLVECCQCFFGNY